MINRTSPLMASRSRRKRRQANSARPGLFLAASAAKISVRSGDAACALVVMAVYLVLLDARVEEAVRNVGRQVAEDDHDRAHHDHAHDHRVVALGRLVEGEAPDAWPREDALDDHRAA